MGRPSQPGRRKSPRRSTWSPSPGESVEVRIAALGSGGRGMTRHRGRQMIVRGALPGDVAKVTVTGQERGVVEGKAERILEKGVARTQPRCPHYDVCGGCDWQHVAYPDQLELKQDYVARRLKSVSIECSELKPILGAAEPYYYRNRMDFSFGNGSEARLMIGLRVSPEKLKSSRPRPPLSIEREGAAPVFDVDGCVLQSEQSNAIVRAARDILTGERFRSYDPASRSGWLRSLIVRESKETSEAIVDLTVARSGPGAVLADRLIQAVPGLRGVVESVNRKRDRHAPATAQTVVAGDGQLRDRVLDLEVEVTPSSFTQVNSLQADRLYSTVLDYAELAGRERVLDLYCGTGALTQLLARQADDVTGVELDELAAEGALRNADLNRIGNCTFVCGDVTEFLRGLSREEAKFDVVCVNPPRSGVDGAAIRQIVKRQMPRVVYVSCNPVTLARDLKLLVEGGFKVDRVQPVDMFPQTHHVEVVVKLSR